MSSVFADIALARRLERAEGHANRRFVEARARLSPASGATWIAVAGTHAMFDGGGSPLTQTFGLGLFAPATILEFEQLERFFRERGAAVFHEVSPLADPGLWKTLHDRAYRPFEFTSVMYRSIWPEAPTHSNAARVRVRQIGEHECDAWTRTSVKGWSEAPELAAFVAEMGSMMTAAVDTRCFLAEIDDEPVATGVLSTHEGVALLAGASTIPERRGQGAQLALLDARLHDAAGRGCDVAMMCAQPGSASQRNAERHGFRIAYTRIKWCMTS
jgi:hypothetical protein